MSISSRIEYLETDQLNLDPKNPRLREDQHGLSQPELLDVMIDWGLEGAANDHAVHLGVVVSLPQGFVQFGQQ